MKTVSRFKTIFHGLFRLLVLVLTVHKIDGIVTKSKYLANYGSDAPIGRRNNLTSPGTYVVGSNPTAATCLDTSLGKPSQAAASVPSDITKGVLAPSGKLPPLHSLISHPACFSTTAPLFTSLDAPSTHALAAAYGSRLDRVAVSRLSEPMPLGADFLPPPFWRAGTLRSARYGVIRS